MMNLVRLPEPVGATSVVIQALPQLRAILSSGVLTNVTAPGDGIQLQVDGLKGRLNLDEIIRISE